MSQTVSALSSRLSLRLDAGAKRKIEQEAATFAQRSVSSFVLASALASAEKIIGDHETLTLSDQDRDRLFAALLDPPPPNRALRSAFADHSNEVVAHGDA